MTKQAKSLKAAHWVATAFLAAASGCTGVAGVPGKAGMYAVQNNELQRLDGDHDWELKTWASRSNLTPNVTFVIRDPRLKTAKPKLEQIVQLHRVGWVRSEITTKGEIFPVDGNQWVDATIAEQRVPVRLEPDAKHEGVVWVVPTTALDPGLYTLRMESGNSGVAARVGVGWPAADKRQYAAANCVDRYLGQEIPYHACAQQAQIVADNALKVHLVPPEIRQIPGQARQLIVRGVVVNTSDQPRKVPVLKAQLVTDQGVIVRWWEFNAASDELSPGASVPFESGLSNPPVGASNVHVKFAALDSSPETTSR